MSARDRHVHVENKTMHKKKRRPGYCSIYSIENDLTMKQMKVKSKRISTKIWRRCQTIHFVNKGENRRILFTWFSLETNEICTNHSNTDQTNSWGWLHDQWSGSFFIEFNETKRLECNHMFRRYELFRESYKSILSNQSCHILVCDIENVLSNEQKTLV